MSDSGWRRLFAGRFQATRLLERAQGIDTLVGVDLRLGHEVIVKTLSADALSPAARARLEYEVAALNQAGMGLLHIHDEEGILSLARAFVPGVTLAERLRAGPLPTREAVVIGIEVLAELDRAHGSGVLHRDLRPSNIVLCAAPPPRARIVDFGVTRHAQLGGAAAEVPPAVALSMSPEQSGLLSTRIDARSDLYSFGVILYECLAARLPFQGETVQEILRARLTARPPPLDSLRPELPSSLARIVERLLRKDPRDRYQTAAGVRADLLELSAALDRGVAAPEIVIGSHDQRATLTEPAFIGRAAELAALDVSLREARAGRGGVVLLEAESGGGKTWVLQELGRRAVDQEFWILHGHGLDQVAQRPYQVLAGMSRELLAGVEAGPGRAEELARRIGPASADVCTSLPELAAMFGRPTGTSPGPEAHGQARSLTALSALLDALGSPARPALVLIDDGQWADDPTLRLLDRWQREGEGRDRHVLVVVAFRSEEVPDGHPLRSLPAARPLGLTAFEGEDVRQQLASMAGKLPDEAVETVIRHAGGNPFLVVATLHGLVEVGALVGDPGGWRLDPLALANLRTSDRAADLLALRITNLSPDARSLLTVGALLGRTFDPVLAGTLAGIGPHDAMRTFAGCRGSLVWADGTGTSFTFLHDKVREALLARLSDSERKRLHRLAAEHLDAADPECAYELAYHFDAAGDPERALPHAVAAAERARARFALELAEHNFRIAARGVRDDDRAMRHRIARGLGEVLALRSRHEEAVIELGAALEHASDARGRAEVEERLGMLEVSRGNLHLACTHCEAALRHLGRWAPRGGLACFVGGLWELAVQALHTHFPRLFVARRPLAEAAAERFIFDVYSSLQATYFFARGPVWATWAHLRALNLVERYPPTLALARVYGDHGPVTAGFPRLWQRGIRLAGRGAALAAELGDPWIEGASRTFLSMLHYSAGRFAEAIDGARHAQRLFERTGDRWRAHTDMYFTGLSLCRLGDLPAAHELAQRLYRRGCELDDLHARAWALDIWARATDGQVPRDLIEKEREGARGQIQAFLVMKLAEGQRLLAEGRPAEAAALLGEALEYHRRHVGVFKDTLAPLAIYHATALRQQAQRAPAWDARTRARVVRRGLRASREAVRLARKLRNNLAHALRESAYLAALAGQPKRARALIDESVAAAEALGQRYERAQSRCAYGLMGCALAWPAAAEEHAAAEQELRALRGAARALPAEPAPGLPPSQPVTLSLIDRYSTVLEAGRRIATALDRKQVFAELRQAALALLRAERCVVLERPDAPVDADLQPAHGDAGASVNQALVQLALARNRPVVETLGAASTAINQGLQRAAVRSALCVPIHVRGRAAACLYVTHGEVSDLFGDEEQRVSQFLATLAGAALENADGFAQIQALSRVLETRVAERTADLARANQDLTSNLHRLRETQDQLVQAGKMAAVGTMVAGLSHELNNPLGVILGYVEGLLRQTPSDAASHAALAAIERQALRCRRLVRTLLDFSRTKPARREWVKPETLFACVTELVAGQARDRGVALHTEIAAEGAPSFMASPEEVETALLNVVSNALDATPAGGVVTLSARALVHEQSSGVLFSVRDTGPGIPADALPRLFDLFFTTKPVGQGTGLGLALTRRSLEAHGGRIDVETAPGAGTCVNMWLPRGWTEVGPSQTPG